MPGHRCGQLLLDSGVSGSRRQRWSSSGRRRADASLRTSCSGSGVTRVCGLRWGRGSRQIPEDAGTGAALTAANAPSSVNMVDAVQRALRRRANGVNALSAQLSGLNSPLRAEVRGLARYPPHLRICSLTCRRSSNDFFLLVAQHCHSTTESLKATTFPAPPPYERHVFLPRRHSSTIDQTGNCASMGS